MDKKAVSLVCCFLLMNLNVLVNTTQTTPRPSGTGKYIELLQPRATRELEPQGLRHSEKINFEDFTSYLSTLFYRANKYWMMLIMLYMKTL